MRHGDLRKIIGVLMGIGAASSVTAQTAITIDSSFGRTPGQIGPTATNTTVTGNRGATYSVNNLYTIAEAQGRTAGANLFHSFGTFNVGTGDAAVFTTTTPTLQNIIARVSGTSASTIQGLLAVNAASGSNPNFFLINPAGVTFGNGAQVDVPAAFHVSTANELRFADGSVFKAGTGPDSSMTVAAPEAFGFVGGNAGIAFNNVQADDSRGGVGGISFSATAFDVTARDVAFDNTGLRIPRANVRAVALGAGVNSVSIDGIPAGATNGDIRFSGSALRADSNGDVDAGSVLLMGHSILVEDSRIDASFTPASLSFPGRAGSIELYATGNVELSGTTRLDAVAAGLGAAALGSIRIVALGDFVAGPRSEGMTGPAINTFSVTEEDTTESGSGISVNARSITFRNSRLEASTNKPGPPRVSLVAEADILLADNTDIRALSSTISGAGAADIRLNSLRGGDITVRDSRIISISRLRGPLGTIDIATTGAVLLSNGSISAQSDGTTTGNIFLSGSSIRLDGASTIAANLLSGPSETRGGVASIRLTADGGISISEDSRVEAQAIGRFDNPADAPPGEIRLMTSALELNGTVTSGTVGDAFGSGVLGNVNASRIIVDGGNSSLRIGGTGLLTSSSSQSAGNAGSIFITGRDVSISGVRVESASDASSTGSAGNIDLAAREGLSIVGTQIRTDTANVGSAGNITLAARTGTIDASQVQSQASAGSTGQAGTVAVSASESLNLTNSTLSVANDALAPDPTAIAQGLITVDAPTLTVRSSLITAESSLNVTASSIAVNADSGLTLDQATVSSTARGTAAAGDIAIRSNGIVALTDSSITGEAVAANTSELTVTGSDVLLDGTSRFSTRLLGGPAMTAPGSTTGGVGAIRVAGSNRIVVGENSSIDARAAGSFTNPEQAAPGEVRLTTPRLEVAGTITTETLGNVAASNIAVDSGTGLSITGSGVLTSSTSGSGNAGNIDIGASRLALSGITVNSATTNGSSGSAGTVTLHATNDLVVANATVRTDTAGAGNAGNVALTARTIKIDPSLISSQAASGSSGQTGTIDVMASNAINVRGSTLSIANAAQVADPTTIALGRIRVDAPRVTLDNSAITAQSSQNVTASAIAVSAPNGLVVRNSNVTTSAQDGNGGNIDVLAQRYLVLDKSQISTSVLGTQSGSGGDISVRANVGVINNGFIQANTAAPGASGGNVVIDVGQLLPIGRLVSGGSLPLSFDPQNGLNAIQAAAPDGVSGAIQLTGPALDIVGTLPRVEAEFVATTPLGQDLCKQGNGSSLTQLGRGGLRPLSTGLLRPDTALALLPELPALSLQLSSELPFSGKCDVGRVTPRGQPNAERR